MAFYKRDFRKDKPNVVNVRTVFMPQYQQFFGKEKEMKITTILAVLVLALGLATEVANADFNFGEPTNLGPNVNSTSGEVGPSISADGLTLYFISDRSGGAGGFDIWMTTRSSTDADWEPAVNIGQPPNSQYSYWEPSISSDGLTLYFSDGHSPQFGNRLPGGLGGQGDIWMITRETVHDAWGAPVNIGPAVNSQNAVHPSISADGLFLCFQSHRPGSLGGHCDIMVATRESTSDSFGNPVFLKNVNSNSGEWTPDISNDGRMLFFSRVVVAGSVIEIWDATRKTTGDDFGRPTKLPLQINVPSRLNMSPNLSADGRTLYFMSNRPGGVGSYDIWQVSISPVVDFNGDGIVDSADMCIMVDYWGTDEPLCDIGPMPWGDGIVNVQDLIVLAEHLFEEVFPVELIAYWKLDEIEGTIAEDSVGNNDGTLNGEPLWQPADGKVGGALQLDGIDDYVSTPFILDPAKGSFSAFVWIKGGAPGQVIISQTGGLVGTWLGTNSSEGKLMTGLSDVFFGALESESVITDGQWHHVGLVYDLASHRHLYVDTVEVNVDSGYVAGMPSDGGLYIGAAKDLDAGSFWSGLIDDVRIYDVALTAEEIEELAQ